MYIRLNFWLAVLLANIVAVVPAMAAPYKIVAYFYAAGAAQKGYTVGQIPAGKLTHLIVAFANIRDGQAVLGEAELPGHAARLDALQQLKRRHPSLRMLLSIGGWTWSRDFSTVAASEAGRQRFAHSAVALMRRHGFDGLDIDWEYPVEGGDAANHYSPDDRHNYTLLLQALRAELDAAGKGRHYLLTSATGASARWLRNTEMAEAARSLDWINLMSYDFSGLWNSYSGHVAPLYADPANRQANSGPDWSVAGALALYRAAGVPADKIVLGLPFYGYGWRQCAAANKGQYQDCHGPAAGASGEGSLDYSQLADRYIDRNGYRRYWNDVTRTPYLFKAETGEFISYEDPQSLGEKLALLKAQGLAGAMFWELTGDRQAVLLDAVNAALRPAEAPKPGGNGQRPKR